MKVLYAVIYLCCLLLIALLFGCEQPNHFIYEYTTIIEVPDSLRTRQAQFVTETVRAASQQMTGGDYEDPEDVIVEAESTFKRIHGVRTECLRIKMSDNVFQFQDVPVRDLTPEQRYIFDSIKRNLTQQNR